MKKAKLIWRSKIFWVNAATVGIGVVGYLAGSDIIKDHPSAIAGLVAAQGVLNVVLRFVTTAPVSVK